MEIINDKFVKTEIDQKTWATLVSHAKTTGMRREALYRKILVAEANKIERQQKKG